ncbi:rhomboid family intramembrane serine protease [Marinobacter sp. X15-166B]|uniref:rhomboid family intramembrane serine protease n=1 Tax=Marinobacter sp. X15-166B TaxID=1897620 RepID=UPI00085CC324|nr:rhomboid family intramembrane serine protease [Marinobacter sp. X15-166B]OEY65808.1 rhomboid family intramembrane serine protease [Marinobacter sp. X15-166B]
MLIIPAENTIDWKRPPWVTLSLILVCLLVFLFYQGGDSRLMVAAVDRYLDSGLLELEAPVYENYLQRQLGDQKAVERMMDLQAFQQARARNDRAGLAWHLVMDRDFYQYMAGNRDLLWSTADRQRWQQQRGTIERDYIAMLSASRSGLIPREPGLAPLITYQFLHGGWGHLAGNLLFLFLLGFTVEKALGAGRFLLAYLACGVLSGVLYTLFSQSSAVPLIGASGSISGLMGMYVAIYGLRSIRFFYFVGFYFNYFRAPALAVLPVWLGKELYDYWFAGATGIAYLAHVGGLLTGAGLILVLRKSWFQVEEVFFEPGDAEQAAQFAAGYARAMDSLARMEFAVAESQFVALWARYPDRPVLLTHLYQLAKLRPDLPGYRRRTLELMEICLHQQQPERLLGIWQEYLNYGEQHAPLAAADHNRALFASLRTDNLSLAERAFARLRTAGDGELVDEACQLLIREFDKRQQGAKASYYRQQLRA